MVWEVRALCMALVVGLAGCASPTVVSNDEPEAPAVEATSTTGGIRGVVVDESITPVDGAEVVIPSTGASTLTDASGLFVFNGLEPGTYFLEASHPFFSSAQASADVLAGVEEPPVLKIQLTRQVFATPYMEQLQISGYIFCSSNVVVGYSEECGEGVGYPCDLLPPDPTGTFPCGYRIGKNENNQAETEWYVSGPGIEHMTVEQVWEPSLEVSASGGGQFRTALSINWVCDPFCGADVRFENVISNSPLWGQITGEQLDNAAENSDVVANFGGINPTTRFTTFTYAADNPGVLLEQPYETFVANSYWLAPPEGWSFVAGDPNPF